MQGSNLASAGPPPPPLAVRWGIQAGAAAAVVAVMVASTYVFVRPWRAADPAANLPVIDYLVPHGGSALVGVTRAGRPVGWVSDSFEVLPGLRALTELPKAFVRLLTTTVMGSNPVDRVATRRAFSKVTVLIGWIREANLDGTQTFSESVHLIDARGAFLLGYADTGRGARLFDPPMKELPARPRLGDRWSSQGSLGAETYRSSGHVVSHGPLSTPTGRYADCITVDNRLTHGIGAQQTVLQTRDEACAGAGGTSSTDHAPGGGVYTLRSLGDHAGVAAAGLSVPALERPPGTAAPASWHLSRISRLQAPGTVAEPTFAPEPIATDPPVVVAATEHTDGITAVIASGVAQGQRAWSFATGGRVYGAPRYDPVHGRLFFGAADRRIYALDARGLFLWSSSTGDNVVARPVVAGDLVIVAGEDGKVRGLEAATGKLRWTFSGDAAMVADPVVEQGVAVVGTDAGTVYGLDVRRGTKRWSTSAGGPVQSPIVSVAGTATVVGAGGTLTRVDVRAGAPRWSASLRASASNGAALDGQAVAAVNDDGELLGYDLAGGARRWLIGDRHYVGVPAATAAGFLVARADGSLDLVDPNGQVVSSWQASDTKDATDAPPAFNRGPRLFRGAAYLVDRDGVLRRLGPISASDPASLALRWIRRPDSDPAFGGANLAISAAPWRGRAVLLDSAGRLYTGDPATGTTKLVSAITHRGSSLVPPVVVGDEAVVLFTGTAKGAPGTLVRVDLLSGAVRWTVAVAGAVQQPLAVGGEVAVAAEQAGATVTIEAFDLRTGQSLWRHASAGLRALGVSFGPAGPVADDRTVYAGLPLTAYDLHTGVARWASRAPGAEAGLALAPDGRTAYLASVDDGTTVTARIVAVDTASGAVRWNRTLPAGTFLPQFGRLLATDRTVVAPVGGTSALVGLDASSGALRWEVSLPASPLGTASLIDGQVWTVLDHGRTLTVAADTGRVTALFPGLGDDLGLVSLIQAPARIGPAILVPGGPALFGLAPPPGSGS
ncbi:MAG: hypothetical protein JWN46_2315 [Acidimicrobiales bacterium]|nr:hypothetical protein [Acidimicrobiales bacterium]